MEFRKRVEQLPLDGLSDREILEGFSPIELQAYKDYLLGRYSDFERQIHLVNDVMDGYGVGDNIILGED